MICPKCGSTVQEDRQSCFNCGAYLTQSPTKSPEDDYWSDDKFYSSGTSDGTQDGKKPGNKYENLKYIIPIFTVVIIIFAAIGWYVFFYTPPEPKPKERSPELDITGLSGQTIYISGTGSMPVTVTLANNGNELAEKENITITLETNVEQKNCDWTANDIRVGGTSKQAFNILIDGNTNSIGVDVYYKGQRHDSDYVIVGHSI